ASVALRRGLVREEPADERREGGGNGHAMARLLGAILAGEDGVTVAVRRGRIGPLGHGAAAARANARGDGELEAIGMWRRLIVVRLAEERWIGIGARTRPAASGSRLGALAASALRRRSGRVGELSLARGRSLIGDGGRRGSTLLWRRMRDVAGVSRGNRLAGLPVLLSTERLLEPVLKRRGNAGQPAGIRAAVARIVAFVAA